MTLDAIEFVRRFLMHVLPSGFVRIRHYGFLANRHRREKLMRCRELLGGHPTPMTNLGGLCLELLSGKGLESAFLEGIGGKHDTVLCHYVRFFL